MCTHKKEANIDDFSFRNSLISNFIFRLLAPTGAKQLCHLNIKVNECNNRNRTSSNFDPMLLVICFGVSS